MQKLFNCFERCSTVHIKAGFSKDENVSDVRRTSQKFGSFVYFIKVNKVRQTPRAKHWQPQNFLNKFVMSLLLIENGLLLQLPRKQSFYNAVTEKFIAQKRRIELCYRFFCNLQHKSDSIRAQKRSIRAQVQHKSIRAQKSATTA